MAKFKEGDRVILKANKKEGWPREAGVVLEDYGNGACMVEVDEKYRDEGDHDGLRDGVPYSSMQLAGKKKKKRKTKKKKATKRKKRPSKKRKSKRSKRRK